MSTEPRRLEPLLADDDVQLLMDHLEWCPIHDCWVVQTQDECYGLTVMGLPCLPKDCVYTDDMEDDEDYL